ncbi:hypothetical protein MKX03_021446, partial [Papaver bracteatum]
MYCNSLRERDAAGTRKLTGSKAMEKDDTEALRVVSRRVFKEKGAKGIGGDQ